MEQITASAGSGKTYTLTRRFLARLAKARPDGSPSLCLLEQERIAHGPEAPYSLAGILAATFTNKAAAEMQARVIRELKQQALAHGRGDPDFPLSPEQARGWIEVILRRFDAVNIRTIDSLLTLLVRLNALSLSLPPDFTPLFSLNDALTPLYDVLLDRAASDKSVEALFREACRSLLYHNKAKGVAAGNLLRDRLEEIIRLHLSGVVLPDEEHGKKAAATLVSLHAAMCDAGAALAGFLEEERLAANANAIKFLEKCRCCPVMVVPDFSDTFAYKGCLDEWLNQSAKGKASDDARVAFDDFLAAYHALKERGPALRATMEFMPVIALAGPLIQGLEALRRDEGIVPASLLPSLALASLESGGVSDAFCRLGDTLVHLLFDEFQDTSTDQWRAILPLVIESLSRGGSLTYVGDVKQAIYGWRGGNAALFDAVARDTELTVMLENGADRSTLPYNWRSAPAIVETNNAVFGRLGETSFARRVLESMLPAKTNPALFAEVARNLAAAFAGAEQRVPEKNTGKAGFVRLQRMDAPNTASLMRDVRDTLENLLLNDLLTRRSPGEVAILVRKNSEAAEVASWLAERQVPVVTEHSFLLGNHPLVTRIADTLSFLEYPPDDAAFLSAVSGPELFAHLGRPDEHDLAEWLAKTRREPGGGPLYAAFRRDFPLAWNRMLAPFLDRVGLLGAYDTVCELIRHCGLYSRFPEHGPFLRRFAEVAYAAETKGFTSLSAFLEYWEDAGSRERVPMPENMDAVRILSMHKAKGLEFPVVVVPFHHQMDPAARPLAVTERDGMRLITYRPNDDPESIRGLIEQINLLYVAWTRPTEELYAFITQSGHSASRSALGKAVAALLEDMPFTGDVYERGEKPDHGAARNSRPAENPAHSLVPERETAFAASPDPDTEEHDAAPLMAWLPRLKIFRNPMDKGFSERQRGLLAHACLEFLRFTGDSRADAARAVDQGLRAFPVPMPDPEGVRRDMEAMLAWYASLPEAAMWLRYGSPEQPVMDDEGGLRRIDLLVNAPGEPLLAVEYKTGRPSAEHVTQVRRYLALLGPAIRRKEPHRELSGVIVYLDLRETVHVAVPEGTGMGAGHE